MPDHKGGVKALNCLTFRKNLSQFLDNELNPKVRTQMKQHLSECIECSLETEKMREAISRLKGLTVPDVSPEHWETTRQQLLSSVEHLPHRMILFRIPKWGFIPIGTVTAALLLYLLSGVFFFDNNDLGPMSVDVCLQEHSLFSEQSSPLRIVPELAVTYNEQSTEKTVSNESTSELDVLMEAHYGIN
jgi:hypothetical protein